MNAGSLPAGRNSSSWKRASQWRGHSYSRHHQVAESRIEIDSPDVYLLGVGPMRTRIQFKCGQLRMVANFLDGRSDNRRGVLRMPKLQVHASAHILKLEHGSTPGGTRDRDLDRFRTELRMPR